jgi:hypothetical protein
MKRIKEFQASTFEFHKEVVKSKHKRIKDPTYKERIIALEPIVEEQFDRHDILFREDKLASLLSKNLSITQKNDLEALYQYSAKPFQRLNDILTTRENGTRQPVCPLCTINNVNTFDHHIPKSEFSELSDHPINLIPCCSECNSKKSSNWRDGDTRKYLNLYLDDLPNIQYLSVNLLIEHSTIKSTYNVENKNQIDEELFIKIENHYRDLELCKRFALNCENTISELKNILSSMSMILTKDQLKESIIKTEDKNRQYFGFNYWKSILKIECCENDTIFDFLLK